MDRPLRTRPYRIGRATIAWIAIEEYVRRFWWLVGSIPLFGVLLLVLIDHPTAQLVGAVALIWPVSIPARGALATWKSGKKFGDEVVMDADGDVLLFRRPEGGGWKLRVESVRGVVRMRGHFVLRLAGFGFVPIPEHAFEGPEDAERFDALLRTRP